MNNWRWLYIGAVAGLLLLPVMSNAQEVQNPAAPPAAVNPKPASTMDYVIGRDDVLAVAVWKEPELTRAIPVRPDGKISLPLVGEVQAAGLTPAQLQEKLNTSLSTYITDPSVSVMVQQVLSKKFNVIGEVNRPGTFPLSPPMTVLDALSLAGGFKDFAKRDKISILRTNADGSELRLQCNYKKIVKGAAPNIQLQTRDTVVVP